MNSVKVLSLSLCMLASSVACGMAVEVPASIPVAVSAPAVVSVPATVSAPAATPSFVSKALAGVKSSLVSIRNGGEKVAAGIVGGFKSTLNKGSNVASSIGNTVTGSLSSAKTFATNQYKAHPKLIIGAAVATAGLIAYTLYKKYEAKKNVSVKGRFARKS